MKRILIVRPDGIGDFVIFSAVLEKYAELYPGYKIDLLCHPLVKDLAMTIPFLDRIFCMDQLMIYKRKYKLYLGWLILVLNLKRYEKIFYPVFSRNKTHEWIIERLLAKEKIAFDGNNSNDRHDERFARNKNFTKIIQSAPGEMPEIERNAEMVVQLGAAVDLKKLKPKIWFSKQDEILADEILRHHDLEHQAYCCLVPGAGFEIRYWNNGSWIELIQKIISSYPHLRLVVLGFGKDKGPIQAILQGLTLSEKSNVINLYGQTSLRVLANIIQKARFCVGMETGTIHIAAAVETPSICLIGGGHFGRFYPYGDLERNRIVFHHMDCFGCSWKCIYDDSKCIKDIKSTEVFHEVEGLMMK